MIEDIPDAFDDLLRVVLANFIKSGINIRFGECETRLIAVQRFGGVELNVKICIERLCLDLLHQVIGIPGQGEIYSGVRKERKPKIEVGTEAIRAGIVIQNERDIGGVAILVEEEGVQLQHGCQILADVFEPGDFLDKGDCAPYLLLGFGVLQQFLREGIRQPLLRQMLEGNEALVLCSEIARAAAVVILPVKGDDDRRVADMIPDIRFVEQP